MALKVTGPPNTLLYIEEMINRILIRIKVVQILYAFVNTKPEATLARAQRDLKTSLEQTYAVYNRLLALTIALTDMQDRRLDDARNRYMPSEEDLNPNTRFIDNRMVAALRADEKLQQYISDNHINWDDQFIYLRATLDRILKSDIYLTYMDDSADDLQHDCELWRQLMRKVILPDPELLEVLQSISLYITEEDVDIMGQFVVKTMRRIAQGKDDIILPPFNDEGDAKFASTLLDEAVRQWDVNNALIDSLVADERWDSERIAMMDRIIMAMALAEVRSFESIPTTVTINEYVELARNFSTPNSSNFVNGLLDAAVKTLRDQGTIVKP